MGANFSGDKSKDDEQTDRPGEMLDKSHWHDTRQLNEIETLSRQLHNMGAKMSDLRLNSQASPAEHGMSDFDRAINYSVQLLERDEHERAHILRELSNIKVVYNIVGCAVLETGCGFGNNLRIFEAENEVTGIEGLEAAVSQATAHGLDVRQGDLERALAVGDGSVDWVLCLDVLEHLVNPLHLMREIHRVLKANGRVVINVPNHFDLTGRLKILLGHDIDVHRFFPSNCEWDNPHLRFFTRNGIGGLLNASGFKIVEDRSEICWSFPCRALFEKWGGGPAIRVLARKWPNLFAGGFFLIAEKISIPAEVST